MSCCKKNNSCYQQDCGCDTNVCCKKQTCGCSKLYDSTCIIYKGQDLTHLGIKEGDKIENIFAVIDEYLLSIDNSCSDCEDGTDGTDGVDGVGITSITDNGDGTFTINLTDGSTFTSSDLTGPAGTDGVGITSITPDPLDPTVWIITYTDGSTQNIQAPATISSSEYAYDNIFYINGFATYNSLTNLFTVSTSLGDGDYKITVNANVEVGPLTETFLILKQNSLTVNSSRTGTNPSTTDNDLSDLSFTTIISATNTDTIELDLDPVGGITVIRYVELLIEKISNV